MIIHHQASIIQRSFPYSSALYPFCLSSSEEMTNMGQSSPPRKNACGPVIAIVCFAFEEEPASTSASLLKRLLDERGNVVQAVELQGSFNFMMEAAYPDLERCNADLEQIRASCGSSLTRFEANLLFQAHERPSWQDETDQYLHSITVTCKYGSKKIAVPLIEKIVAEADYVRIFYSGQQALVHSTLSDLETRLDPKIFKRVHRSAIVNRSMIDRILYEKRRWQVRFRDGTTQNVSRNRVKELSAIMGSTMVRGSLDA